MHVRMLLKNSEPHAHPQIKILMTKHQNVLVFVFCFFLLCVKRKLKSGVTCMLNCVNIYNMHSV